MSVGSLEGMLLASFPKGQEKQAAKRLTQFWMTIKQEDIFVQWPFPYLISAFISKPSFFDSTPEANLINNFLIERQKKLYRRLSIGITDAQAGQYIIVNDSVGVDNLPKYLEGSSALPGILKYVVDKQYVYIDGGIMNSLNLEGGIDLCKEQFGEDTNITIDVIVTKPSKK